MIIQFVSEEDRIAAELIQKTVGGRLHKGYINPSSLNDDIICIGGQYANSLYAAFVNLNIFPEIIETTEGTVYVRSYNGFNVYAVAGWLRTQTIAAAEYIFLYGLPSTDTIAGDIGSLTLYEIGFKERTPDALTQLAEKLGDISAYIVNHLPTGYNVDYVGLRGNILEILIRSDTGLQILEFVTISISMIIVIAIIVVGLVLSLRIVFMYAKDIVVGIAEVISKNKLMSECMAKYECKHADAIKNLYPEKKINWFLVIGAIAGLGFGTYYIAKAVTPVVKKNMR